MGGGGKNGSLFGRKHAVNGVSKTKDVAGLSNISINNPKRQHTLKSPSFQMTFGLFYQ